jgi:hypothetical protein
MSTAGRIALLVSVAVVAVVAFIILKPSDSSDKQSSVPSTVGTTAKAPPSPPPIANVRVKDGKPVGGIQDLEFAKGDTVQFAVTSDVADEVHVHGYDLMKDIAPGETVNFSFPASITGIFEVELEDAGEQIAQLRVDPD